jgi:hypothetical protein
MIMQNPGRNLLPYETAAGNAWSSCRHGQQRVDGSWPRVHRSAGAAAGGGVGAERLVSEE